MCWSRGASKACRKGRPQYQDWETLDYSHMISEMCHWIGVRWWSRLFCWQAVMYWKLPPPSSKHISAKHDNNVLLEAKTISSGPEWGRIKVTHCVCKLEARHQCSGIMWVQTALLMDPPVLLISLYLPLFITVLLWSWLPDVKQLWLHVIFLVCNGESHILHPTQRQCFPTIITQTATICTVDRRTPMCSVRLLLSKAQT